MITSNQILQPSLAEKARREHQFDIHREQCIWCGMTREQIEEWGERICPRREPRE